MGWRQTQQIEMEISQSWMVRNSGQRKVTRKELYIWSTLLNNRHEATHFFCLQGTCIQLQPMRTKPFNL